MKKKSEQAKLDKKELERDLATFESNYSEKYNLRPCLKRMQIEVGEIRKKMQMSGKYIDDGIWIFTDSVGPGDQQVQEANVSGILKNSEIN